MNLEDGSIIMGVFQDIFSKEETFLVYRFLKQDPLRVEFLEPGKRYYLDEDIEIYGWTFPKDKLSFPGNGLVKLPVIFSEFHCYSPKDENYSEIRKLLAKLI